jgi:hypothetical protein
MNQTINIAVNGTQIVECPSGSQTDDGEDSFTQTCVLINATKAHLTPQKECKSKHRIKV